MRSTVTYSLSLLVRRIPPLLLSHAANTTPGRLDQGPPSLHRLRVVGPLHHSLQERTTSLEASTRVCGSMNGEVAVPRRSLQKKLKKCGKSWHVFRGPISGRFQPHFHHNSTTIYHAIHHDLRIKKSETPLQKRHSHHIRKNYKI